MDIISEVIKIRKELKDFPENKIDKSLKLIPPFKGSGPIKLVIIGQDHTIRNVNGRRNIKCTLNLDKEYESLRKYIDTICYGLGISINNVYATNVFKYFYSFPPADTPNVLAAHLELNLALLKVV